MVDGGTSDPDFTFAYVVLGTISGSQPIDGKVDGKAVLEAGYGGAPVGPDPAVPTTVSALFGAISTVLS